MHAESNRGPRTMFDKIWAAHQIIERDDGQTLLYVDRHLIHDGSGPAFDTLAERGLKPRAPEHVFGTPDHYAPTDTRDVDQITDAERRFMVESLTANAAASDVTLFGLQDRRQGIVHVIGPEQGISQPGMVLVCGDSHTSTHGALGALAFGVGMTEVAHALATRTLWQRRPRLMRIVADGRLSPGVTAKDLILKIIATIGTGGATGHAIEYAGSAVTALSIEGRLTVCNMSIEAGARAGMIAPDDVTFRYLNGRPYAPRGREWDQAVERWRQLPSDPGAAFDREVTIDATNLAPMATWGTSPQDAMAIDGRVPDPATAADSERRDSMQRALEYMGLVPGQALTDVTVDRVFIGSCTNGRIEDLREAAAVARGRKVPPGLQAWVVPGSRPVKDQAEAEGLDRIFRNAGFQWRHAGCSMCLGTNGEIGTPGQRIVSTSNRNFVGRQGRGVRTHLVSPAMAAAAAVTGQLTDVRQLMAGA